MGQSRRYDMVSIGKGRKEKKGLRRTGGIGASMNMDMAVSFSGLELIGIGQG